MVRVEGHVAAGGCGRVRKYLLSKPEVFQQRCRAASADLVPGTLNVSVPGFPRPESLEGEVVPQLGQPDFETDIGLKSRLNENQAKCFELTRGNQRNVELVTFDELLQKIKGLRSILGK